MKPMIKILITLLLSSTILTAGNLSISLSPKEVVIKDFTTITVDEDLVKNISKHLNIKGSQEDTVYIAISPDTKYRSIHLLMKGLYDNSYINTKLSLVGDSSHYTPLVKYADPSRKEELMKNEKKYLLILIKYSTFYFSFCGTAIEPSLPTKQNHLPRGREQMYGNLVKEHVLSQNGGDNVTLGCLRALDESNWELIHSIMIAVNKAGIKEFLFAARSR